MPSIPLPFIISLLLAIVSARMARRWAQGRANGGFLVPVVYCAILSAIVGLRWTYDEPIIRLLQPILASALPPLIWISFAFSRRLALWPPGSMWLHAIPTIIVIALRFAEKEILDPVLVAVFVGYGLALIFAARRGSEHFSSTRIGEEPRVRKAMFLAGALLILSGVIDFAVSATLAYGDAAWTRDVLTIGTVLTLAAAGYAVIVADGSVPPSHDDEDMDPESTDPVRKAGENDADIVSAIDILMRERQLYRDPNLTLDRLARRACIPARQVSGALNRTWGRNISQVINEYRVEEAKRLLIETRQTIVVVMLEAGFQTKSNFNREFYRVTGTTPSDFRRSCHGGEEQTGGLMVRGKPFPEKS
ncbi:MAG: helix-turn-helix transcriptional regulator [Rhizobiales bacterium]|nr:helix-turn-helix transcriptional regulator [Hyphomicrobiales bacterium]OJX98848.1 MAG: hypothetical protein BGP07_14145 [Rhizobiales bacterium 63-22]